MKNSGTVYFCCQGDIKVGGCFPINQKHPPVIIERYDRVYIMYSSMMVKMTPPAVKRIPLLKKCDRRGNIQNEEITRNKTAIPNSAENRCVG